MTELFKNLLARRGIDGEEAITRFLNPRLADFIRPADVPGIEPAAERIVQAMQAGEHIVVFGDYDCDGVCATAILVKTLEKLTAATGLPATIRPFLPARMTEGYGMSDNSVARMRQENPKVSLIITVDNGVTSVSQIDALRKDGISVIVTDHHLPGDRLPNADILIDPKAEADSEYTDFCGATISFLLANAVVNRCKTIGLYHGPSLGGQPLVLAGLATVTDIMPLTGQNRILVAEALNRFHKLAPVGLVELYLRAARTIQPVLTSRDFGFMIGPRINAAGRVASGDEALALLLTENREFARNQAQTIDRRNIERKSIEQKMVDEALKQIVPNAAAQVIDLPDGHPGVAGIVAARVMERVKTPVGVVVAGHGSARASDGINVRDALNAASRHLTRFGGHAAAAGFTVKAGEIDEFRRDFCKVCAQQAQKLPQNEKQYFDLDVEVDDLTLELVEEIQQMEPFGEGNPEPVFRLRNVKLSNVGTISSDGRHLSFSIGQLNGIWWGHGYEAERLRETRFDAYCTLVISDYRVKHLELRAVALIESKNQVNAVFSDEDTEEII